MAGVQGTITVRAGLLHPGVIVHGTGAGTGAIVIGAGRVHPHMAEEADIGARAQGEMSTMTCLCRVAHRGMCRMSKSLCWTSSIGEWCPNEWPDD